MSLIHYHLGGSSKVLVSKIPESLLQLGYIFINSFSKAVFRASGPATWCYPSTSLHAFANLGAPSIINAAPSPTGFSYTLTCHTLAALWDPITLEKPVTPSGLLLITRFRCQHKGQLWAPQEHSFCVLTPRETASVS